MSEASPQKHTPGGYRELIALSLPLILGASFWTVQIFIDRVFIAMVNSDALAATMPTVLYFWTPFVLINSTVLYATVFVAQYTGAGRPHRIGPVVWQALWFSLVAGLLFPLLTPVAGFVIGLTEHTPQVKLLELEYFRALSFAALPMLIVSAVNSFFAGRGDSWTVLLINAVGMAANGALAYPLIVMQKADPVAAMHGAGYAAALGSAVSAALGLVLLFRRKYRAEFATWSGWRFDGALFRRLMKFGLPNGVQWCIEGLAFTAFLIIVGNIGVRELAATNLTFSLNMLAFLPVFGLAQGVEVLVGQRQGESRPDLSEKTTWTGVKLATGYMVIISALYCLIPGIMTIPFARGMEPHEWAAVGAADPGVAAVRGPVLAGRRDERDPGVRPARGGRRPVRDGGVDRPGVAGDGAADVAGVAAGLGAGVRLVGGDRVHRADGGGVRGPVPPRQVADDEGDRGRPRRPGRGRGGDGGRPGQAAGGVSPVSRLPAGTRGRG